MSRVTLMRLVHSWIVAMIRRGRICDFQMPDRLASQVAAKGSIAVDGISLTVVEADSDSFTVALIPHTLEVTTLGRRAVGDRVNLETDVLAKYVERSLGNVPPNNNHPTAETEQVH